MMKSFSRLPIAVTMGEPAGIGGEITLRAWALRQENIPPFFVIDEAKRLQTIAAHFRIDCPITVIDSPEAAIEVFKTALPVLPIDKKIGSASTLGSPTPSNSPAVVASIDRAVSLVNRGKASAVVTNPIQKSLLVSNDFPFPGHTEYLGHLAGSCSPVMMLAIEGLRVVPVTIHIAIKDVANALTTELIVHCGRVTASALQADFGIQCPRLAVAALNPHAGEHGRMGTEETRIIRPAINQLKGEGIQAFGPAPADTLFHENARKTFDAALCMYHDQALLPLKTIDFASGVNITLGLPFVSTSPDHGTACDIAAKGIADPSSLLAALRTAYIIALNRAKSLSNG